MNIFKRSIISVLLERLHEPRQFIQILMGPRQVGKTTLVLQLQPLLPLPCHYASSDDPVMQTPLWIEEQWEKARTKIKANSQTTEGILILDEIQKINGWAEMIKKCWDEDTRNQLSLKVVLLGSAQLLIHKGLNESLAGRFEVLHATHWSYEEMKKAFGWNLNQFVYFGGYPGTVSLISEHPRWRRYILDSLIETTISKDILQMTQIEKPSLLKNLFILGCHYSGRILSYQKMLGQLQEAGSTVILAHYLQLLSDAGLLTGLQKFANQLFRRRSSSPKLQVFNTALISALSDYSFEEAQVDREFWGHLVESCVGAHLINGIKGTGIEVFYWLHQNQEVDFILRRGKIIVPIEVKSGRRKQNLPGMAAFCKHFKVKRPLLVGDQGIPVEEFLLTHVETWVRD